MRSAFLLALLLAAPGASACQAAVYPLIDLEFPQKARCSPVAPEECDAVPDNGSDYVREGTFHWRWDLENCGSASFGLSMDPVVVTFEPYARNPGWLEVAMEPSEIAITFEDQWDLSDDENDPTTGSFTFREDYPVTVTIRRSGDPTAEEFQRLSDRSGVVELLLKVHTSETEMFQPAFSVEPFSFDARSLLEEGGPSQESPSVPVPMLALALLACVLSLRRRR